MPATPSAPLTASPPPAAIDNTRGLLLMGLAFLLFSTSDVQSKFLTGEFHPTQIVWTRQLGLLSGVLIALALKGPSILKARHPILQLVRGGLAVISATTFIFAVKHVPLADAVAISFVAPFLVTAMGALILGEKVGARRWTAVAIGFVGAMIVIRPGMGATHPAALLVVVAAAAFACRQIISRRLAATDRTVTTVAYTAIISVVALSIPLPFHWTTPAFGWQWALFIGMAATAGVGELLTIKALEIAQAAVLAPMHYSLMIWGTIYGWLVFGQLPDAWTWTGAAIIMATGLYIIHRERQLARASRRARATPS